MSAAQNDCCSCYEFAAIPCDTNAMPSGQVTGITGNGCNLLLLLLLAVAF
jgi:hypothetical protein